MRFTVIFALFAFAVMALAVTVPPHVCPGERDNLLGCFSQLIDGDQDGNITVAELDFAFGNLTCLPTNSEFTSLYNSTYVMNVCDVDSDGVLSMADWTADNACLKDNTPAIDYVCRMCYLCGYEPLVKK
jgi:hypothetical protein